MHMRFWNRKNYKWEVLALLWIAFFHNQAGRQVFNIVIPLIRDDLQLTDGQMGSIATVYNLVFALVVPVAGYLGDLYSRKWLVVLSIFFFSAGTIFTGGLGTGMLTLIILRGVVTGASDTFIGPPQYALLASYHENSRAYAMSIHQTSFYTGILAIGFLAGYIGERYGWRAPFYIIGAVGLILGIILIFRLKDKNGNQNFTETYKPKFLEGLKIIFRTPTALILVIGFGGLIFVLTGYLTWMPTYLYENFSMTLSKAGFQSMFYTHFFAFVGVIVAGKYSDIIAKRNPASRMLMQGVGLLVAVPFIIMMGHSNKLLTVYIGFAGFGFARAFFDANTYTVLYDVIPEKYRSSATGILIMIGFGLGSLAPIILGFLKPVLGLSFGIASLAFVWTFCGSLLLIGYKYYYRKDYENVNQL